MTSLKALDNSPQAILFLALIVMRSFGSKSNSKTMTDVIFPELLFLFDIKVVMKLIKVYGGRYIKIPSGQQLQHALMVVIYFYCKEGLKMSDEQVVTSFHLAKKQLGLLKKRVKAFKQYLKKNKIALPKAFLKSNTKLVKQLDVLVK